MGLIFNKCKNTFMIVDIAGFSKKCKYKTEKYYWRQDALADSKENDKVTIKKFSYQKSSAYAIINDRLDVDIGVIPACKIPELEKRFPDPSKASGVIELLQKEYFSSSGDTFIDGSIILEC